MRQDIATMQADLTALADIATEEEEIEDAKSMRQQCEAFLDQLESTEVPESFRTGVRYLDSLLGGGFRRGRVAVFASETSGGKSIALIQAATEAATDAKRGVIFSMEMSSTDIISRMTAYLAQHPIIPRTAGPTRDAVNAWGVAVNHISRFPLVIHDQISGIDDIERIVRTEAKTGLDFLVVDYLQLCQSPDESKAETREQQVSEVMRRLKLLALSQNVLVMTASQLNDKGELRESRAIGHHADYVLHIDHSGEEGSFIRLMKNRNGERFVAAPILMRGALSQLAERTLKK
jgi:replicative DNA helicase